MLATLISAPITGLTPIPLTVTDDGYTVTINDSQPIIPPNSGGLGVEVDGSTIAQEPGQSISVEGAPIASGAGSPYAVTITSTAPHSNPVFQSVTVSSLPVGVTATVALNSSPGVSTITFYVAADATPGFYPYTIAASIYDMSSDNVHWYTIGAVTLYPSITIGPAWPPPQVLTTDGTVTLTTDDYAYSINKGDTIDIGIYAEGFTAFTGYWNFFLSEQSPERIVGTTPRFQNLWCVFPSNNKPESYSPTPGTPTLITTATLVTTLTTPPGVYAFTLADGVPTGHLLQTSLVNSGNPTSSGAFTLAISEITPPTPSVGGATFLLTITGLNGFNSPCTLGFIDLYDGTLISFYSNPAFPTLTAAIIPNSNLAPGTYTYTIQAAQGNVQFNGTEVTGDHNATIHITVTITATTSQFEGFNSATINVQVMDVGGEQATAPSALLSGTMKNPLSVSRRAQTGLVATSHQGRQVFRALAIPTNRRTPPQTYARARHVSITAAQALQTDTILEAWSLAAAEFPGHDLIPGDVFDGVTAMTTYLPMTPAQFQYLCQSTQLAFNNPVTTLPAPVAPPYALAPGEQIAWYPQAESMIANAVYNAAYVCIGFTLAYTYLPTGSYFGGYASSSQAPNGWIISATSASASSVSSKSGSGFSVLGYYVGYPTPAQILADWIAVYGDLPDKGTIYFSVRPADPFVGVTGMEMTSRCSYENGTLAGAFIPPDPSIYFDISTIWVGPKVTSDLPANQPSSVDYEQAGAAIIPPGGANDVQLFFQGVSAFGGNGWTAGAPYAGTLTCEGVIASVNAANSTSGVKQTNQPTPPITITFNPPTVTIPNGDTTPVATTATFHLPAGTPSGTWLFHLKGTDGKQTLTQKILVECNAGAPSASGLALTPMASAVPIVSGTDRTINFTLSNPNSAPQTLEIFFPANLIYYGFSGPIGSIDFSISPGTNPVTVPAGTPGTPGTVNFTLHIHPTGTITTGRNFNLLVTATNPYITLAALLDFST